MIKKTFIFTLAALFLLFNTNSPSAEASYSDELNDVDYSVFDKLSELESKGLVSKNEIPGILQEAGWIVDSSETLVLDKDGQVITDDMLLNPMSTPQSYTLTIWGNYNDRKRNEWTIYSSISTTDFESYPASYDLFSLNWDPSIFSYRTKSADTSDVWLAESKDLNGTLLFNMRDTAPWYSTQSAWVGLTDENYGNGIKNTTFSINFVHTYDKTKSSTTQGGNASWKWGDPLTVGISYSVTKTTVEDNWGKANLTSIKTKN